MASTSPLVTALAVAAGAFALKQMLIHMYTVRCKVLANMTNGHMPEDGMIADLLDHKKLVPLGYVFRVSLMAFGEAEATEPEKKALGVTVARLLGAANNNVMNEPFFFLAAGAVAALAEGGGDGLGGLGPYLVYTYVGSRVLHNVSMVARLQPARSLAWFTSALVVVAFSVAALKAGLSA